MCFKCVLKIHVEIRGGFHMNSASDFCVSKMRCVYIPLGNYSQLTYLYSGPCILNAYELLTPLNKSLDYQSNFVLAFHYTIFIEIPWFYVNHFPIQFAFLFITVFKISVCSQWIRFDPNTKHLFQSCPNDSCRACYKLEL